MIKVIIDTNILLSGLISKQSKPAKIIDLLFDGKILEGMHSIKLFSEYQEVLNRVKFSKILSSNEIGLFLEAFLERSIYVSTVSSFTDCKDPNDNMLLELAVDGQAHCIVTGDKLVLALHPFKGIPILNPSDFLDWINLRLPTLTDLE